MLILLNLSLVATLAGPAPQTGWSQDFDQARKIAQETHRDLLVDFSGSDWCPWCKKIDAAVFGRPDFVKRAGEQYVLVNVDLPRTRQGKAKVPDMDHNQILAAEYRVANFPTVCMMTAGGEVYATTGYLAGGVDGYLSHLEGLRAKFRPTHAEALKITQEFETADAQERAALAARALAIYPQLPSNSSLLRPLGVVLAYYETLDPENQAGDLGRALKFLLPSGFASHAQMDLARRLDHDNSLGLLELSVLADCMGVHDGAGRHRVALAILELDKLGPIKNKKAAEVLYSSGCLWVNQDLDELAKAKDLGHKALPFLKQDAQMEAKVRKVLHKRGTDGY